MGSIRFVVWGLVFIGLAATSQAQTFSFECITHNDENNCDLGEATLSVEVGDADIGNPGPPEEDDERVLMIFRNVPLDERHMPTGPVVEAIYIEDPGGYLSSLNPIDSDDVSFSGDPTPRNLPGGSTLVPPFSATRSLSADADPPAATNGVGPTEELTLVYYGDFDDVSPQLSSGIRIGIHVISFENGGSESFILVPESGARCGDGEVTPDEECDDGDDDDNDGCRSDCTLQYCGDGILDEGEECDDGNGDDDDCCDDCEIEDDNDPDDDDGCRDDGNPCTDDVCTAGICTHPNNTSSCNDGDACTTNDQCSGGACGGGGATNCDDGNACTADSCDEVGGCQHSHLPGCDPCSGPGDCDNGSVCDGVEGCIDGRCQSGDPLNCDDGEECTTDLREPDRLLQR
jgi:cysteine-rich repeat protein